MPFIKVEEHLPGITGLLELRKDTGQPIRDLTQLLMRGPNTLTEAERELIAMTVSNGNQCTFCTNAHTAAAERLLDDKSVAGKVKENIDEAPVGDKMRALLKIAAATRISGKNVTTEMIAAAKTAGATDVEIHDTVLIAALFCMYNRYVDGLSTTLPNKENYYLDLADRLATHGYIRLPQGYDHLKTKP